MTAFRPFIALVLGLSAACPCAAQGQLPTTPKARFAALDSNHDGTVSNSEYDADALFRILDTNRDYRISADEVEALVGAQEAGMPSAADRIRTFDLNGDGELSAEELHGAAEARFNWLDTNHDDKLDLSELRAGFGIPVN